MWALGLHFVDRAEALQMQAHAVNVNKNVQSARDHPLDLSCREFFLVLLFASSIVLLVDRLIGCSPSDILEEMGV